MGETNEYFTDWNETYESFDQMQLHENLLRGIYAYGARLRGRLLQRCLCPASCCCMCIAGRAGVSVLPARAAIGSWRSERWSTAAWSVERAAPGAAALGAGSRRWRCGSSGGGGSGAVRPPPDGGARRLRIARSGLGRPAAAAGARRTQCRHARRPADRRRRRPPHPRARRRFREALRHPAEGHRALWQGPGRDPAGAVRYRQDRHLLRRRAAGAPPPAGAPRAAPAAPPRRH